MSIIKQIFAITFVFVCTTIAWMILGQTIFQRTYGQDEDLKSRVSSTWGTAQSQAPPSVMYKRESERIPLPLTSTRADVRLQLEHRQKGLLWYSTYRVAFAAAYTFENDSGKDQEVAFSFPLPAEQAMYDNLVFAVDDAPVEFTSQGSTAHATAHLGAGKATVLKVGYSSQGMDRWNYSFSNQVAHVRDFK